MTVYYTEYTPSSSAVGVEGRSVIDLTSSSFADLFSAAAPYNDAAAYRKGMLVYSQDSIWVYVNASQTVGNDPPTLPTISNDYWELVGTATNNTFVWIAYANSVDGTSFTDFTTGNSNAGGIQRTWIGIATNKTSSVESTNPADYSWSRFVGADGVPGDTLYTWYAYADSADGQINFTTGSPGTRVYQGISPNNTSASEAVDPAQYTWSAYVGPPGFGLAAANGGEVSGAKILKRSGGTFEAQVYSTESYVGGAFVSFKLEPGGDAVMVGINTDPTTATWQSLDYAIYLEGGTLYSAESGTLTNLTTYTSTDTFAVHYDGASVKYYKNGTVIRTVTAASGIRFFLDSSMSNDNGVKASITAWSAAGAQGATGATGSAGAPAIGFVQDDTPGAGSFISQTWYRPTSKEWYRWTGSSWSQILGALSTQDLIADSAFIANGVILTAKIGDLQVDTVKIAGNAVTVPNSAYSAGSVTASNAVGGQITLQSMSITTSGAPVYIAFSTQFGLTTSSSPFIFIGRVKVFMGATEIYSSAVIPFPNGQSPQYSFTLSNTPAAGTYTLSVVLITETINGAIGTATNRSLFTIETKK